MGSGILFAYPQLATIAGVQGVVVYALSSALPLLIFAALGPAIRRRCPEGFVLTEWTRQRYGAVAALYLGFMTLLTLFLYMVAELSAISQVVTTLSNLNGLPVVIVQCVVTTIYTSMGGFKISFLTDNVQGAMVLGLIIIATITIGVETRIDPALIESSGLLQPSLLGWQLLYILPVAILTNDFFLSSFWLRTFASKTDRDLWIGVGSASAVILCILGVVGTRGDTFPLPQNPMALMEDADGSVAFFTLLQLLPNWVVGIVLVMAVTLSTAAFDSLQSAMVSSASNDLFRNRLGIWYIRTAVVLVIIPVIVIALRAPSILQIYLISDMVSAATIPVLVLGLSDHYFYWWRGFDVVCGGLGGILSVFIFGTAYYGDANAGGRLILLEQGLYTGDWGVFGAFVAAPVGGMVFGVIAMLLRVGFLFVQAKASGGQFTAFERPLEESTTTFSGDRLADGEARDRDSADQEPGIAKSSGRFF
ncbi:urea transporter [Magnaporthiopsis poae ATCC 64411]|uniref:Urea transporter n=1 Tax=Magnaporthiopsis poae (strain ATCC 64411 / 73-15) TaxID=644358 RepID=A0A0C4EE34_MAGP6|nr:urea transporter [Magnaporthiopsis poae ATCC 64411]